MITPTNTTQNDTPTLTIQDGLVMADSRDVATKFGKRHDDVRKAVQNMDCSPDFLSRNFAEKQISGTGGRPTKVVYMTRDGFAFLVMGFTGKDAAVWKEKYISAFNLMEREILDQSNALADLTNPVQALETALAMAKRAEKAEAALADAQDDVFALARIAKSDGSMCITDAAKTLQMRPKDLFVWLRANSWIYRRTGNAHDVAYQDRLKAGYLEHKVTVVSKSDGSEKTTEQVRVTPKGLEKLAKELAPAA